MPEKALDLFETVPFERDPTLFIAVYNACASLSNNDRAIRLGRQLWMKQLNRHVNDVRIMNSLLHMLMKFGDVMDAERVFQLIEKKTVVTYGAMMKGD